MRAKTKGAKAKDWKRRKDGFLVWDIEPKLKARFKAACGKQGRTIRDVVAEMMEAYAKASGV